MVNVELRCVCFHFQWLISEGLAFSKTLLSLSQQQPLQPSRAVLCNKSVTGDIFMEWKQAMVLSSHEDEDVFICVLHHGWAVFEPHLSSFCSQKISILFKLLIFFYLFYFLSSFFIWCTVKVFLLTRGHCVQKRHYLFSALNFSGCFKQNYAKCKLFFLSYVCFVLAQRYSWQQPWYSFWVYWG